MRDKQFFSLIGWIAVFFQYDNLGNLPKCIMFGIFALAFLAISLVIKEKSK